MHSMDGRYPDAYSLPFNDLGNKWPVIRVDACGKSKHGHWVSDKTPWSKSYVILPEGACGSLWAAQQRLLEVRKPTDNSLDEMYIVVPSVSARESVQWEIQHLKQGIQCITQQEYAVHE